MRRGKEVSFYEVPLVCNAVTHIGCGSRSKPVLDDLRNQGSVKQAWLNRSGTVIALEWDDEIETQKRRQTAASVFRKHELPAEELEGETYDENLKSFISKEQWLAGNEVDELSKEEARVFAERVLSVVKKGNSLSEDQEREFGEEIQHIFYDFFLNYESLEQLSDISVFREKFEQVIKLGEKYTGKGNMPNTNSLLGICCKDQDCCE